MNYKKTFFYDVESFPTFFCVTFMEDGTDAVVQFSVGCGINQLNDLKDFLKNEYLLVGFNNLSYDDPVIRYVQGLSDSVNLPKKVFELSKRLISESNRRDEDIVRLRYPREVKYEWTSMDLFKIMHFDRLGVGLKQIAINLKHELIQDLPLPYDYKVSKKEEVDLILNYNINDVIITKKLYYRIQPQIKLREEVGKLYNVNLMNASDSKMGNLILEHTYKEELGIDVMSLKDLRTKRSAVTLGECIPTVISFNTKELQTLHKRIAETTVFGYDNFKFEEKITFKGTKYSIGSGGIHSMETSCRFDSTDEYKIISCDIGSMYPTCIILNNIYPEHLDENFVKVLSTLTADRLAAKKTNKVKAEGLKITINGLYGKLNSDTYWLEDGKAMLRVTIAGQLYILMLIEMLSEDGINCISANTDGIECKVPTEKINSYYEICKKWETLTGFSLEFVQYKSYIKRDVNNYIAIENRCENCKKDLFEDVCSCGGKKEVKTKGAFIPDIDLKKGYKHPIVARAVYEYFVNNIPVEKTINNCRDIFEFCISQKVGKEFQMQLKTLSGLKELQRTNRFYVSLLGGYLQKKNINDNRIIGLFVKQSVQLLNEYDSKKDFDKYGVNLSWYIKEAKSMIEEIEPSVVQDNMFGADLDFGKRTNFFGEEVRKKAREYIPKEITEKEIRNSKQKKITYDTNSRYCLVTNVDTKYSPKITFYSLTKGIEKKFKIKKDIFSKKPLEYGDVVSLIDFEKQPRYIKKDGIAKPVMVEGEFELWLTKYSIINNFEDFKRKNYDN